jgi:hypothetical protein
MRKVARSPRVSPPLPVAEEEFGAFRAAMKAACVPGACSSITTRHPPPAAAAAAPLIASFADFFGILPATMCSFCTTSSARALLMDAFGPDAIREEALVRPLSNNVAFLVRR